MYAPQATLDATVPNWRLTCRGPAAIADEYGRWFAHPGRFDELARHRIDGGEVVTYLLTWFEHGVPHAAHHCHVLHLDDDGPDRRRHRVLRRPLAGVAARRDGRVRMSAMTAPSTGRPGRTVELVARPLAASVDELLAGARRQPFQPAETTVELAVRAGRGRRRAVRGQVRAPRPRLHDAGVRRHRLPAATGVGVRADGRRRAGDRPRHPRRRTVGSQRVGRRPVDAGRVGRARAGRRRRRARGPAPRPARRPRLAVRHHVGVARRARPAAAPAALGVVRSEPARRRGDARLPRAGAGDRRRGVGALRRPRPGGDPWS